VKFRNKTAKKVLTFIAQYLTQYNQPPSVRQVANAVGLSSTSAAQFHLKRLTRLGYLIQAGDRGAYTLSPQFGRLELDFDALGQAIDGLD
jgi:repressor LexA